MDWMDGMGRITGLGWMDGWMDDCYSVSLYIVVRDCGEA